MTWREILLGDGLRIRHGYAFKGEHFSESGTHIVLTPGNFYEEGGFRPRPGKDRFYVADIPENFVLSEGNVIVAMTEQAPGLLGSSALIPEDNRYLHNQRLGLVDQVDPNTFDQLFLYYLFNTSKVRHQINASATGTKVRHTAPERIYRVRVRVPDVAVQRAIGRILQAYDDLIENNRRRMALLEEASRQLYKEWFVRLRFPGHEHCRLLNGLPEGWRTAHLSEITSKIGSGSTPRGGEASYQADGITLIRSLNVYDDRFNDDGLAFISESQAAALASVTVEPRDILLNITGASVARCCMAPERYLPARVNQHVMIIRVNPEKANPFFVHAAINSDERKRQLLSYSKKGSTREALTKEMMGGFEITLASDALTDQLSQFADKSFRQREIFALQNQKLKAARDLLLPRLMSGEIAV